VDSKTSQTQLGESVITAVDFVTVNVADQERAKRFYTSILGCELLTDVPMGEPDGPKWIEVRPPGAVTKLVLFHDPEAVGKMAGFVLATDDIVATCESLEAAGAEIVDKAAIAPWGSWWAQIKDSEGNGIGLTQQGGDD
jgi:predicted enzyme related to lactoylglutathione lyase